jgi:hypothetical protein
MPLFSACTPDIQIVRCGGQEINFYRAISSARMETTAIYIIPPPKKSLPCYKVRRVACRNLMKRRGIRPLFQKIFFTEAKNLASAS